ncbi:hypothetical protein [Nocardia altamirensis]|uniref:hypothetical protein n=1 Tax=Nocardia altamirensis TaxID=472158 RepID=UPI000A076DD3|nr:hypothetical protein [Nocardia altamirensis]
MPSNLHEIIIELVRRRPELIAELLTSVLGMSLPEHDGARLDSTDLPDIEPTEYRADAVVTLTAATKPVLSVVVEVQLQPDKDKIWSWPVYLTTLRARLRCLVLLVVVCPNQRAATSCRHPITVAPGFVLTPVVLSPNDVPMVTDPDVAAAHPALAVLSAIAHRHSTERDAILKALADTAPPTETTQKYIDMLLGALPRVAGQYFLRMLMMTDNAPYFSDQFRKPYFEGKADSLLGLIAAKHLEVSAEVRAKVTSCTDAAQLDRWMQRLLTATTVQEIFAP